MSKRFLRIIVLSIAVIGQVVMSNMVCAMNDDRPLNKNLNIQKKSVNKLLIPEPESYSEAIENLKVLENLSTERFNLSATERDTTKGIIKNTLILVKKEILRSINYVPSQNSPPNKLVEELKLVNKTCISVFINILKSNIPLEQFSETITVLKPCQMPYLFLDLIQYPEDEHSKIYVSRMQMWGWLEIPHNLSSPKKTGTQRSPHNSVDSNEIAESSEESLSAGTTGPKKHEGKDNFTTQSTESKENSKNINESKGSSRKYKPSNSTELNSSDSQKNTYSTILSILSTLLTPTKFSFEDCKNLLWNNGEKNHTKNSFASYEEKNSGDR